MDKNVLVISTSPRVEGNSEILADEFIKGADGRGTIRKFPKALNAAYEMGRNV